MFESPLAKGTFQFRFFPRPSDSDQAGGSDCRNFQKLGKAVLDNEKHSRRILPVQDSAFFAPVPYTRHHTTQWLRPPSSPHRVIAVVPQGLCSVCMLRRFACVMDSPV